LSHIESLKPNKPACQPTLLIILDGFGHNPDPTHNAILQADTPRLDHYFAKFPTTTLQTSGAAVGLPDGQMGNSEVGHMTIGCGNIFKQDLVRIDDTIKDGRFFDNPALLKATRQAVSQQRPLHLIGLVSEGGVHSHINQLFALIECCRRQNARPVLHMITDGRDTAPHTALQYLPNLQAMLSHANGYIATVSGRFFAMDRDNRWARIEKAWQAMVAGHGMTATTAQQAIEQAYHREQSDEFIVPTVIGEPETIQNHDSVIFFNFRNDRARQLSRALTQSEFTHFNRPSFHHVQLTTLTEYDPAFAAQVAYPPIRPKTTLTDIVSQAHIKQFHCAETEKYAHVTFFINGGKETPVAGEDRKMVPSPSVSTYDLAPEMSATIVADEVIKAIKKSEYGLIIVNFANGDMVGHTAKQAAIIKAVEALDREVGRVLDAAIAARHNVLLTADHGNCELMVDPDTAQPHTQHTQNPVPCLVISEQYTALQHGHGLANVAATVLQLMGLEIPQAIQQKSILIEQTRTAENRFAS